MTQLETVFSPIRLKSTKQTFIGTRFRASQVVDIMPPFRSEDDASELLDFIAL